MKKIGLLVMALILALGGMGVGFAHWSQTLYIDGTVETGTFLVGFEAQSTDDPPATNGTPGVIYPDENDYTIPEDGTYDPGQDPAKNVAACDCELLDKKGMHGDETLYEKVKVTVLNAYPCYTNILTVTIGNGGTIPANVGSAMVTMAMGSDITPIELPKGDEIEVDLDGDGAVDVNLTWDGPADQQIDPCDAVEFTLEIHVKQGISDGSESVTKTFVVELDTVQWNYPF